MATKIPFLFEVLKERGITQKKLAEDTGISTGNISDWKSGKSSPKPAALAKIAKYLGCSVDYLLGNDTPPRTNPANDENERNLIAGYRELNEDGQKLALIYVTEFLLQNPRYTQKSSSDAAEEA
ncbi:MAG: helix-turn-helix domain-containing protein [Lachnospiraceae bacterium]|nr:helix-turn-helix domain-containing protein [Ruminococcus sp.]MCM1276229.1 helix-turn-helix domain-containing protein [Lachnospiraceae bacterium]